MRKLICLAVVLCSWSAPVLAEDSYYFHKAGITRDAYQQDVNRCARLAAGGTTARHSVEPTNRNAPYAVEAAAIASLFAGFMEAREQRRLVSRIERTCMADKGYQRRTIDRDIYGEIRKLTDDQRLERLHALVSSATPTGKVLIE